MKKWIINSQTHFFRECLELTATCLLWTVFVYFASGFSSVFLESYMQGTDTILRLFLYFMLAILNALVLVIWALYNRYRHQNLAVPASHVAGQTELATSLALSESVYQTFQNNKRLYVDFNSHGDVVNVSTWR
ncbi:poly-beta-1,6-N-acetyl-D-glucosamine biosynthesis protein PgaD [Enterobacter ludwigii]